MRLPNGFGSISKLSGNRRNPYIARKTIGYHSNGSQRYVIVGYFETREEALNALSSYNQQKRPTNSLTVSKLFHLWLPTQQKNVARTTISSYHNSYRHLAKITSIPITDIKFIHLQSIIDEMKASGLSYSSCKKVRTLINLLFKFAIINDWVDKSYGQYLNLGGDIPVYPHKPFTRQQINKLWYSSLDTSGSLILLYTGMRCSELLNLRKKDINLKSKYLIITESKTTAGRNRIIPIHNRIMPIIENLYFTSTDKLFPMNYSKFSSQFKKIMKSINCKHTTHDCRHTFASLLDRASANPNSIRALLGHKNGDITIRVYTHKSIKDLRKAINLLK